MHLGTGLLQSCLSDEITDVQGLYSIDVQATHAHGIQLISHTPIPTFGSKHK